MTKNSTAQHCTAQHCTAQHGTARHGTARHGTARHGTARHGTAHPTLHSTAQHCTAHPTLHSTPHTAQHSTALHSTALHCTAQGAGENNMRVCCAVFSHVPHLEIPETIACQAPMNMGFPRQEYWNGVLFPTPRDLPDPGIQPASLESPAAAAAAAKSLQSCPTLCNPIDSSSPGSPIPGILQARTLEWNAISLSNA